MMKEKLIFYGVVGLAAFGAAWYVKKQLANYHPFDDATDWATSLLKRAGDAVYETATAGLNLPDEKKVFYSAPMNSGEIARSVQGLPGVGYGDTSKYKLYAGSGAVDINGGWGIE